MTRITAVQAFNMSLLNEVAFGAISPKGVNAIAFDYAGGLMRVWGDYTFEPEVGLTGGVVSGLTYLRPGGEVTARIYGLGLGAMAFQDLAQSAVGKVFYPAILVGDDSLAGSSARDVLFGHGGNDLILGNGGNDNLYGGAGDDRLFGGRGVNALSGGPGSDRLVGGAQADRLVGGAGFDSLVGGDGDDVLLGGAGDDALTGGTGADTFVFGAGGGRDVVFQLDAGDRLKFSAALWGDHADAEALVAGVGSVRNGNAVLDFGTTRIVLADVVDLAGLADQILPG